MRSFFSGISLASYARTAAAFAAAAFLGGGINDSTSNHSHRFVTYLFWYGVAGVLVAAVIVLTIAIERRKRADEARQRASAAGAAAPSTTRLPTTVVRTQGGTGTRANRNIGVGTDSVVDATDETDLQAEDNVRLDGPTCREGDPDG